MSTNLLVRLQRLLPQSQVILGTVVEHLDEEDASIIELPTNVQFEDLGSSIYAGAQIIARGRSVAVGLRAFVRDGVVESEGPSGGLVYVTIGSIVAAPAGMAFNGEIPDQAWGAGTPVSLATAPYFSSPFLPLDYAIVGALPAGLALDPQTGVIAGTKADAEPASVSVSAMDAELRTATSNAFDV